MPLHIEIYTRAVLCGSLCFELFQHFESKSFDSSSFTSPISLELEDIRQRHVKYYEKYEKIKGMTYENLAAIDDNFFNWFSNVKICIERIWTLIPKQ